MRDTLYLGCKCYQKQTFILETELLAQLELKAKQQHTTLSELVNNLLKSEVNNDAIRS
ncbi:hypothetical protein Psest_3147 [Stutzerimonas stutzeri RCH2]|jgi:predicted HicB family RNase H-like nuclease|uniref:Ribbon-helix-helix protein, copG family n=1 Tax=Stutzerimonas stutzeri RCH2 TaxID=644801 RepID=L0GLM2_STUST|nr:hypothetical protein Psest_3147 [Stutzerimonas stutzeri RCH2]